MHPRIVLEILEARKVLLEGHFAIASGRHTNRYFEGRALSGDIYTLDILCYELRKKFEAQNIRWIVGPPMGGIPLATLAAKGQEGLGLIILSKDPEGNEYLLDDFDRERIVGSRVAIVDDFKTTGGSLQMAARAVQNAQAEVVQFGVVVDRDPAGAISKTLGAPLASLLDMEISSWEEKDCPLCKEGVIPVDPTIGHGPEFYARQSA